MQWRIQQRPPSVCHKFVVYDMTFVIKFMEINVSILLSIQYNLQKKKTLHDFSSSIDQRPCEF